ncbi:venom serine carboxypeptidase-like [Cylas formicarius]|uniref:venom serine carboxypeptidase-like n=1 Tax=Cylas formicarius TaxID=197179 RepID=UPI002958C942|nr:venom serine carboxypeptidase-like [Cylas formicarius]
MAKFLICHISILVSVLIGYAVCAVEDPLIITDYLNNNQIKEARAAALVSYSQFRNVTSYSGYFTVDQRFNSNLFFWFFPSQGNVSSDPVILWLQGGPGIATVRSLFDENGPFIVDKNLNVTLRNYTWTRNHSMLFIDNPVGVGYSFTNGGYARNETIVAQHLYKALTQFFQLFSELKSNDFYASGVSYAGKYCPVLANYIIAKNENATSKINLKGIIVESPFVDPQFQSNYSDYLYQIGLIDNKTRGVFKAVEEIIVADIKAGDYQGAMDNYAKLIVPYKGPTLFQNATGFDNDLNYLEAVAPTLYFQNLITRDDVRSAIHVGNNNFTAIGINVFLNLLLDYPKGVGYQVANLLNQNYRVLFYNGQTDVITAYVLGENFLSHLTFNQAAEYKNASRVIWRLDNDVAGYVKQAGTLTEVLIRNAGHWVAKNQPRWTYELILKFTRNNMTFG